MKWRSLHFLKAGWDYLPAVLVGCIGCFFSVTAALWLHRAAVKHDEERFSDMVRRSVAALDTRVEKYQQMLETVRDWASFKPDMISSHWKLLLHGVDPESCFFGMPSVGIWKADPTLPWPELTTNGTSPSVWVTNKAVVRAVVNSKYTFRPHLHWTVPHVDYVENQTQQTRPAREAIRSGRPKITQRQLIGTSQKFGDLYGTLLFIPIVGYELAEASEALKIKNSPLPLRTRFQEGVVFGAFEWNRFLNDTSEAKHREITCDIYASTNALPETRLTLPQTNATTRLPFWQRTFNAPPQPLQTNLVWKMFTSRWCLSYSTTPAFAEESTRYRAWLALGAGVTVSLLMSGLLAVQIRARLRDFEQSRALLDAQNERMRISRDLHDGAIQSLYAVQLALGRMEDRRGLSASNKFQLLADSRQIIDEVIEELRRFLVHEPNGVTRSKSADLATVIRVLVQRLQTTTEANIQMELDEASIQEVPPPTALHLAALTGEALSNAVRHGKADTIHIRFGPGTEGGWHLEIADNGVGFHQEKLDRKSGLHHLQGRVAELGGTLTIESLPGTGTRVIASIPRSR